MTDIALHVNNLSKRYYIGRAKEDRVSLRDTLLTPIRRLRQNGHSNGVAPDHIWALQDVSFDVKNGEVVGLVGRNGAGKSTLLKILSQITEPSGGKAVLNGRVGSLLEVGTGFHPELTGRENIYFNGAILGMKKIEIDRKFDEIVDFSGIEKFIDTPVKRYSSGMTVRLAFAVAAHLEPEILLIDEVLAVGDVAFQKKCLDKMDDVGQEGRTVLFVSHNMAAVTRLCQRAVLISGGKLVADGPAGQVVSKYLNSGFGTMARHEWPDPTKAPGGEIARLRSIRVKTEDGQITDSIDIRRSVSLEMEYDVLKPDHVLLPHFHFFNEGGVKAFSALDVDPEWRKRPRPIGRYVSKTWIPGNFLAEGMLFVDGSIITLEPNILQFYERSAVAFQVVDSLDGDSARGDYGGALDAVVRPLLKWDTQYSPDG